MRKIFKGISLLAILLAISVTIHLVNHNTSFFQRAFGKQADIKVDLSRSYDMNGGVWRNLDQGGEGGNRMLKLVTPELNEVGINYIRIDHIYDSYDVIRRNAQGKLTFDWKRLDATIGDILSSGAKPFISLSYMPQVLSGGNIVAVPYNWADWEVVVQKTVEHISGQLGIDGVYYEVWNEPELFGKFGLEGSKNYLELYHHSILGAASAKNVKQYKIGGPAIGSMNKKWIKKLINYSLENNLRLDFISWHRYSKNLFDYEKDMRDIVSVIANNHRNLAVELIISESGPNTENDSVYDGGFSAIHLIATSALLEDSITRIFNFEIKDGPGPEKYWGRWGMFTHEKFGQPEEKPRFKAMRFLNILKGEKLSLEGEGSWIKGIAKKDGNIYRLLVVNYDPHGKHYEVVPITFLNLPSRKFVFRKIHFLGRTEKVEVNAEADSWKTLEGFWPNTAVIFEIIPL